MNPWKDGANNGGATAPGVTKDEVKVVVYIPTDQELAAQRARGGSGPINQTTGQPGGWRDNFKDFDTVYQYAIKTFGSYQTWGRHPVYEFVEATGSDEAAQRADALAVIAKKPFIVIDAYDQGLGAPVFESEIAKAKIIVNGAAATSLSQSDLAKQAPYRWATQSDSTASLYLMSSFLGTISGQKAQYAGDTSLQGKTRSFGLVTPTTGIDVDLLKAQLKKNGVSDLAGEVTYDATNTASADEIAKTNIAKLQTAGVTTVILVATQTMIKAMMAAATSNNYKPEWIETGYQFSDFDGYARGWDQDQASHTFGIGVLNPLVTGALATNGVFPWYWGTKQGTTSATGSGWFAFIYGALAVRRAHAHRAERAEGSLRASRGGWCVGRHGDVPDRLRQDGRVAVRRVLRARDRRRDDLVEPEHHGWRERGGAGRRQGQVDVPEQREALLVRVVPEGRQVLRHRVVGRPGSVVGHVPGWCAARREPVRCDLPGDNWRVVLSVRPPDARASVRGTNSSIT